MKCKHCGQPLTEIRYALGLDYVHAEGRQRGLHRCDTEDSGLMYGYNAEPVGQPCGTTCVGSFIPEVEQ